MKMNKKIYVGFDSTVDKVFLFNNIIELSEMKKGKVISKLIGKAIRYLKRNEDVEIPIDNFKYKDELEKVMEPYEKIISLGGNAAIESSTFHSLGMNVEFSGAISKSSIKELKHKNPSNVADFIKTLSKTSYFTNAKPTSFIIQILGNSSRVILCNGEGRRYDYIKKVMVRIPRLVIPNSYFSIVGWNVLFPDGLNNIQENEIKLFLEKLKRKNIKLFADLGSFEKRYPGKLKRLYKLLLGNFDILSMNEYEYKTFLKIMNEKIENIFAKSNLSVIHVHSSSYQWSLSKTKEISDMMYEAQKLSEAAGTFRIENMKYPKMKNLKDILSRKSIKKKINKRRNFYYLKTETIKPRKILSTVGAGDVSFATLISSLFKQNF